MRGNRSGPRRIVYVIVDECCDYTSQQQQPVSITRSMRKLSIYGVGFDILLRRHSPSSLYQTFILSNVVLMAWTTYPKKLADPPV